MKLKTTQKSRIVDSIRALLRSYNCNSKRLMNLLFKPYIIVQVSILFNNNSVSVICTLLCFLTENLISQAIV